MSRHDPAAPPPAAAPPRRRRVTRPGVIWADRTAAVTITFGGLAVIAAVLGILVYLVVVARPLFAGATLVREASYPLLSPDEASHLLFAEMDEYRAVGLCALDSGEAILFAARDGEVLGRQRLFGAGERPTAFFRQAPGAEIAFGFADGTVQIGRIGFEASFVSSEGPVADGVIQRLADGSFRKVSVSVSMEEPARIGASESPVVLVDYRAAGPQARLAVLQADRTLHVAEVSRRTNLLTGAASAEVAASAVPYPSGPEPSREPGFLLVTSRGDQLYLAWRDGTTARYDLRDTSRPLLAERADLVPGTDAELTALELGLGEQSILSADSWGRTRAWFRVPRQGAGEDGYALVPAHTLSSHASAVTVLAGSSRDRTLVTGAADGSLIVHHVTSERRLGEARLEPPDAVVAVQIAPKGDGLFAVTAGGLAHRWRLFNPHPETSLSSIFGKVWYEGYAEPAYTWQSSSGTDDFEPKLSLVPLIFGTLKATLYAMLFALPIALCAALYTSEFLDPRYRTPIKSTIEMMASLPSVVLGFIAALVLAPLVESWVMAVLTAFAVIPLAVLGFGYLWQTLPPRVALAAGARARLALLLAAALSSALAARWAAGPLERLLFQGDFKAWLDGRIGGGAPGILLLAWPPIAILLLVLDRSYLADRLERRVRPSSGRAAASLHLAKYLGLIALSVAAAALVAVAGAAAGVDPRGALFGTYAQRNALVVGFAMGFAVIPIIYTIAEDALSAVPSALRSASLGCGATQWQTATRVVLPVALPGIFSALMVGLGRAVGETMIVLMAAGNTPLLDLNVFNGLRTLSANIAVELPEAAKDGTLYRMLFLAALILFLLTFVVNTLAEVVRQRFRRRAYQL